MARLQKGHEPYGVASLWACVRLRRNLMEMLEYGHIDTTRGTGGVAGVGGCGGESALAVQNRPPCRGDSLCNQGSMQRLP